MGVETGVVHRERELGCSARLLQDRHCVWNAGEYGNPRTAREITDEWDGHCYDRQSLRGMEGVPEI